MDKNLKRIRDPVFIYQEPVYFHDFFSSAFHNAHLKLSMKLTPQQNTVMWQLVVMMNYGNRLITSRKEIQKKLEQNGYPISLNHLSAALTVLRTMGVFKYIEKGWGFTHIQVSEQYFWKGSAAEQRRRILEEQLATSTPLPDAQTERIPIRRKKVLAKAEDGDAPRFPKTDAP